MINWHFAFVEEVRAAHLALKMVAHILQFICLLYLNFLPPFHRSLFMNSVDTHRLKDQERLKSDDSESRTTTFCPKQTSHSHTEVKVDILKGIGEGFVHPLGTVVKGQGLFHFLRKSFKCHTDRFYQGIHVVFSICL